MTQGEGIKEDGGSGKAIFTRKETNETTLSSTMSQIRLLTRRVLQAVIELIKNIHGPVALG